MKFQIDHYFIRLPRNAQKKLKKAKTDFNNQFCLDKMNDIDFLVRLDFINVSQNEHLVGI